MQRAVVGADAVAVSAGFFIEQLFVEIVRQTAGRPGVCGGIFRLSGGSCHAGHQFQRAVVVSVDHRVDVAEYETVGFAPFRLAESQDPRVRPVDDIFQRLSPQVDRRVQFGRQFLRREADESVRAGQCGQRLVFQRLVMRFYGPQVAGVQVVVPGDQHRLQDPFGRPSGVPEQVFVATPRHRVFAVDAVVRQLVDQRVGFVRDAFAVAVHI